MNYVEPIRDTKKISRIKKMMRKESKLKELTLFELGIKTGLRISDILNLRWCDVIVESDKVEFKDSITIYEKKTSKRKQFRLSDNVKDIVMQLYREVSPEHEEYIFKSGSHKVSGLNRPWTRQYVWQFLNDYAYRSGIRSKIGTHTLRKTFGYHAFKSGVDLSLLMKIFNHSSQDVTLRYIGITQDQIDDVYINLDKIL